MNTVGVQQTKELLVAVGAIARDVMAANADGKVTKLEIAKMVLGNAAEVFAACSGISEVAKELADIQPEEMDELYAAVMGELQWPEHSTNRDLYNIIFNLTFHIVNSWRLIQNTVHPPKARVVYEIDGVDPP